MELMTISEAARRLGYKSRSQLYRLINGGYLHEPVHVQQHTRQRLVDIWAEGEAAVRLPVVSRQRVPKALATELQWATLRNVIELVQDSLLPPGVAHRPAVNAQSATDPSVEGVKSQQRQSRSSKS